MGISSYNKQWITVVTIVIVMVEITDIYVYIFASMNVKRQIV